MIPDSTRIQQIKKGLYIPEKSYFELAHEHIDLKKMFLPDDIIDLGVLIFDLILYPVWIIFSGQPSVMDMLPLLKCGQLWRDLFRFQELSAEIWYWELVVKLVGGPWISTNDPTYHTLVYADAMTRLTGVYQRTD